MLDTRCWILATRSSVLLTSGLCRLPANRPFTFGHPPSLLAPPPQCLLLPVRLSPGARRVGLAGRAGSDSRHIRTSEAGSYRPVGTASGARRPGGGLDEWLGGSWTCPPKPPAKADARSSRPAASLFAVSLHRPTTLSRPSPGLQLPACSLQLAASADSADTRRSGAGRREGEAPAEPTREQSRPSNPRERGGRQGTTDGRG